MSMPRLKGIAIAMGDAVWTIPPLSLGAIEVLQSRISAFRGDVSDPEQIATVIDAAHSALRRNYPDITREQVAEMVDLGNMAEVFEAAMDVSGLKRKALEGATPGEAAPGTQ
jgi:hypothetical protein